MLADPDRFDAELEESIRLFEGTSDVFERARSRLCYGERLRRANRRRDARRELGVALDIFDRVRAASWADRTCRELRASGEHRHTQTPETRDELTPQERRIAALATEGHTNREIAALLLLSPVPSRRTSAVIPKARHQRPPRSVRAARPVAHQRPPRTGRVRHR